MSTLWSCYHCKEPVAPNATRCPKCGGHFNAYSRGYMRSQVLQRNRWEHEKAGSPPKSGLGCAIPLAIVICGALIAGFSASTAIATEQRINDILSLRTGMTIEEFAKTMPAPISGVRPNTDDTNVSYFGDGGVIALATSTFDWTFTWRHRDRNAQQMIKAWVAPPEAGSVVTAIERELIYETLGPNQNAPLTATVIEDGLKAKYGTPSWWGESDGSGEIGWVFHPRTGQPVGENWPALCGLQFELNGSEWWAVGSAEKERLFIERYGELDRRCGKVLKVKYITRGKYVSGLHMHLLDIPVFARALKLTTDILKTRGREAANKREKQAEGRKPKF